MRDTEKLNNTGSTKPSNPKEHIKLKVDSPQFKTSSAKHQRKKHRLKSKSPKLGGCTNVSVKTATDSSNKAPTKDSSNKSLIIRQSLHKTDRNTTSKKIQGGKTSLNNDRKGEKDVDQETNIQKRKRRRKKKRQRHDVDLDDTVRLQRRTRNILIRMKQEQNLIDAYAGEGWKGQRYEENKFRFYIFIMFD